MEELTEKSQIFTETFQKELRELITGHWKPDDQISGIVPVLNGESLRKAIDSALDERQPLIEGFLYSMGVSQIYAGDGEGKSSALLNAVVEASSGLNVFKGLPCPKPLNIIWHCAERPLDEPFERIKLMETAVKPNLDNLIFDKEIQGMDLTSKEGFNQFFLRMTELVTTFKNCKVDVVVIDPIYAITGGDLSSQKDTHTINNIIRTIQNRFNCAVIYTHHTNRGGRHEGKRTEGDMYGSRFLSANVTGAYHLKKTDDGVELLCKKNTYGNLLSHIPLVFDEMSQTLSISKESEDFNKRDNILLFLRKKHSEKKEFFLREIANQLKVSDAYIRKTLSPFLKTGHILNKAGVGSKAKYWVEKNV
jgi:RecA-family ATPase